MSSFIERYPIALIAGAVASGLLIRAYLKRRAINDTGAQAQAVYQDQNPWQMLTPYSLDAYQYYTTSTSNSRFVYGDGKEVALVSTDMLQNALDQQKVEILTEVRHELSALSGGTDQFISDGGFNPYDVAIAGAARGQQMAFPQSGAGNVSYE